MEQNEQRRPAEEPQETERTVPDKQIHRWKDDGGPVAPAPELDPEPAQDRD